MYSYVDIIRRERELVEKKDDLHIQRINLVSPLYNLRNQYRYIFRVLPDDFNSVDPHKFDKRLEVLIDDIEVSSLTEQKKEETIDLINNIIKKLNVINNKQDMYDKFLIESVGPEKEKRRQYLEEVNNKTQEIIAKIELYEKIIEERITDREKYSEMGYEPAILKGFDIAIEEYKEKIKLLKNDLRKIYSEKGLAEEIELYRSELSENELITEPKLEETKEDLIIENKNTTYEEVEDNQEELENTIIEMPEENKEKESDETRVELPEEETPQSIIVPLAEENKPVEFKIEEIDDTNSQITNEEEKKEKTENKLAEIPEEFHEMSNFDESQYEEVNDQEREIIEKGLCYSIIPEPYKYPVSIHKASEKLIAKARKFVTLSLGITIVGAALALNPVIGSVLGAGLITKEMNNLRKK